MTRLWGGLWLLVAAALALLVALVATGLADDVRLCGLDRGHAALPNPMGLEPGDRLRLAWIGMKPLDLAIAAICVMPLAVLAVTFRGRRQWAAVLASVALSATTLGHLIRESGRVCDSSFQTAMIPYLAPSVIAFLMAWRIGMVWAEKAGE